MPTYDYECDACEHRFELFQNISENPKKKCPQCGKPKLRRLFGAGAGIVFKGSGFYQTDYRSDSYRQAAAKDTKPAESTGGETKTSAPATKSETKSESKTESKPAGGSGKSK